MAIRYYPAIIERGNDGFGAFFPDLPGCVSHGPSIGDAAIAAAEALRGHIALMVRDRDPLPEASDIDALEHDPDIDEATRVLVPVTIAGAPKRVMISVDDGLLDAIDAAAKAEGATRSGYLAQAARERLELSA